MGLEIVVIDGEAKTWEEAIHLTAGALLEKGYVKDTFEENCIKREKVFPTGLNTELPIAIPHTESEYVRESAICFLRLKHPVTFVNMESDLETVEANYVLNLAIKEKEKQVPMLAKVIEVFQDGEFLKSMQKLEMDEFQKTLKEKLSLD